MFGAIDHQTPFPLRRRLAIRLTTLLATLVLAGRAHAQTTQWTIDAKPLLTLGKAVGDESEVFASVSGATRLPNGNVLVADRGEYSMHIYSPTGQEIKKSGRKGTGPGEFTYLASLFRCGTEVLTYDIEGSRMSVFSLDGTLRRSFRWSTRIGGNIPYKSACNRDGVFVHYGWPSASERKIGVHRGRVPLWMSGADSAAGRSLGTIAGSERWGQAHGSRPLPLGREPRIAMGTTRAYVGEATNYTINVFAVDGKPLAPIKKAVKLIPVAAKDVSDELERELGSVGEKRRKGLEEEFAKIPMPKTLPPYRALAVDALDNLWVQDYARSAPTSVMWTVFDARGQQVAAVQLPFALDVFEIGSDYVLGRYLDEDEGVPQVRMYRLLKRLR